jgi:alkyl sulfatase BDS1-like metallo-beta-lactamase superfamily hydrolase
MDVPMLLDYIAVQVDSIKAQHTPFTMNIVMQDTNEIYFVEMSNGNLSNIQVDKRRKADATITLDEDGFNQILLGKARLVNLIEAEQATLVGDDKALTKLIGSLVKFDPGFEIVPFSDESVDGDLY